MLTGMNPGLKFQIDKIEIPNDLIDLKNWIAILEITVIGCTEQTPKLKVISHSQLLH